MADPFACFGDEGSDSDAADDIAHPDNDRAIARQLVAKSNSSQNKNPSQDPPENSSRAEKFASSRRDQQRRAAQSPWPARPPLYLGPIRLDASLSEGGGRGYVASRDLPPGTCVLIEGPLVGGWSEEQLGRRLGLESVGYLMEKEDARVIIDSLKELHPRKEKVDEVFRAVDAGQSIDSLDRIQIVDMMAALEEDEDYCEQQQSLVSFAKARDICNTDGSFLSSRDINRLLLTLRYNGFESGLYLHFSMFNHDEDPNCIKFRPGDDASKATPHNYSEARTTRFVKKGDALTLHYLENPREVSHATRRKILWDQHRFDIGDEAAFKSFVGSPRNIYESELVGGNFPPSIVEESNTENDEDPPTTVNIEKSLDDLEDILLEIQNAFKSKLVDDQMSSYFDRSAALELTIGELIAASNSALNNNHHILLSRCRRLHLDVVEMLLSSCSAMLTSKQSVELMARFLQSVQPLLGSQIKRCGSDHPDVARTYHDFSMGIQSMLSNAPKRLLALKLDGMTTLEQCSKMENLCRSEKARIEQLYPRDVAEIIAMVKKP